MLRVEDVAQPVPEHVEGQHDREDRGARAPDQRVDRVVNDDGAPPESAS
jgi:hypothetical protein